MLADRVFGPTTTTRNVYDVAAQHVVSGTMEGISGNYLKFNATISSLFSAFSDFLLSTQVSYHYYLWTRRRPYSRGGQL